MKRLIFLFLISYPVFIQAQIKFKDKRYQSLFWEITGNGLKKPSYLFGTMHVSSKIAFHLSDSFYLGIKNADVVALETNPESWQEDLTKYDFGGNFGMNAGWPNFISIPNDFLSIRTLQFTSYEKKLEQALYSNPSTINNLLYRSYSDYSSDFEEDTYLDMYIYQVGKKWGKKVAGVERYDESMKLMMEAYRDAAKDKNRKERSFDFEEGFTPDKLQEAYRTGNLDLLDSINKLNSFSDAFDEKFLYQRNNIQAASIDSIMKAGKSLFVGVGAAHLPGQRGVIEILRKIGYKMRPILMGERDSHHKDQVESIRVPVVFIPHIADDEFYQVSIPGKFYRFRESNTVDQEQYADMANGSYYMVTRVQTHSGLWGHPSKEVARKIDSVLYENIPGRILSKVPITKNGYKGFDVQNRTRRGDFQRYNIFITPFEILFFKMSGTGDYVKNGIESDKFFNSIRFSEFNNIANWKKYQPASGGFSIEFPHEPFISKNGNWQYEAEDKTNNLYFTLLKTEVHNYHFAEEDSFDLGLMEESFSSSEFIDQIITREQRIYKGYPSLECKYWHTNGSFMWVRFLIQGPYYYTLVARGQKEHPRINSFLNSFTIVPYSYETATERKDTLLYFSVKSPVFPELKKEKIDLPDSYRSLYNDENEIEETEAEILEEGGIYRNLIISNDTTGEKIYVSFYKIPRYYYSRDSTDPNAENFRSFLNQDTTWIIRDKNKYELPNKIQVWEYTLSDTNSSRTIHTKTFNKNGIGYVLITQGDTLSKRSSFIKTFFETFIPAPALEGVDPYSKKSKLFFRNFFSSDSSTRRKAVKSISEIEIDEDDISLVKKAIRSLNWNDTKYLDNKKAFINKLGKVKSKEASNYLKELYYSSGDTIELQYAAIENLLQQETKYSYTIFKQIMIDEPPVLNVTVSSGSGGWVSYPPLSRLGMSGDEKYISGNGNFLNQLYDSLLLTKMIFPDLMPLLNLNDYKWPLMRVLARMVENNLIQAKDYEIYFSRFLIEAKQEFKKQSIVEKKKSIDKAQQQNDKSGYHPHFEETTDNGNEDLGLYATLLLPYWKKNVNVPQLFQQLLKSSDNRLKYNIMNLMLRNQKKIPDTLIYYFAALDEFRYELYSDLRELKLADRFPSKFKDHLSLVKSKLLTTKSYGKPDSLVFIDKFVTDHKGRRGFIYFFRYKQKKDDANWKFATAGMIPEDSREFEYPEANSDIKSSPLFSRSGKSNDNLYDFTEYTEIKIKDDEPVNDQLRILMKRILYSKRKSASQFYDEGADRSYDELLAPRVSTRD